MPDHNALRTLRVGIEQDDMPRPQVTVTRFHMMIEGSAAPLLPPVHLCLPESVLCAGAFFGSIMQRLQVRFYSISSSPLMHPKSIHITCAVVYEKTVTGSLPCLMY